MDVCRDIQEWIKAVNSRLAGAGSGFSIERIP